MSAKITILKDGPYLVDASEMKLMDAEGATVEFGDRDPVALCRCGRTATEPFCDGKHKQGLPA